MTKIGVTAHATETVTPSMLPALGRAFGHTFAWSLGITVLALAVASFLPRKKLTKVEEQMAHGGNIDGLGQ
jgi:hypothetical protein